MRSVYLVHDREVIAESEAAAEALWPGAWAFVRQCDPLPESAPVTVSMRQARLALYAAGRLDDVQMAIDALSEPTRTLAQISWDTAGEVSRGDATTQMLAAALGLSPAEIDDLFAAAAAIA